MQQNFDKDLLAYFTDVEQLRTAFKNNVAAPRLTRRLLVIYGIGGVGKSSLLRMFRLHCKSVKVPVALASGDEEKSELDVLVRWASDLKVDGVLFPSFGKTYERYRLIQAKVDEQSKKAHDLSGRAADIAGKAISKTAETAGGALAGAAIGSVIPGIGTAIGGALGGVVSGMGTEAVIDWFRGFLNKPDIDLLLDPTKKLTDDFLADLAQAADKQRIVLMLDTFEKMTALDDWARDIMQRLNANVFFVLGGRAMPNWSRTWQSWMAIAQVEELKPMTDGVMRDLVRRYYSTIRGGEPNPEQVEEIIRFAGGLPIVVTSAVQLWVKYGVEDFQSVKAEILPNLVDRLMEGVPNELIPALEGAASVRWFDQPILRAVTGLADVRDVYNELRRFPFVRVRMEGLALHDAVREIMDANLHAQDSERYRVLHERATEYFEKRLEKATGEEVDRLGLERLYHRVHADEEAGVRLFQQMAEELTRYRLVNRLRTLLNDVNTYLLERESSRLWREYYGARLAHFDVKLADAEKVYQKIAEDESIEPRLRAYALCDWGEILVRSERLSQPGGTEKARRILEQSQKLAPQMDSKLISTFLYLHSIYNFKCDWEKGMSLLKQCQDWFEEHGDKYGAISMSGSLKEVYGLVGNWRDALNAQSQGLKELSLLPENPFLRYRIIAPALWILIWAGRYKEAEEESQKYLSFAHKVNAIDWMGSAHKHLAYALGMQKKYEQAILDFAESAKIYENLGKEYWSATYGSLIGFWGAILIKQGEVEKAEIQLSKSLKIKRDIQDNMGIPEILIWLGIVNELNGNWSMAESFYRQSLVLKWTGRCYFECVALTSLIRVKHAQSDFSVIPTLISEGEALAQKFEYNDLLASLRLTQGHLARVGKDLETSGEVESGTLLIDRYRHALIYALRYNRFLLDEVLGSQPQSTPLRPIIPECLKQGEGGRKMLNSLRDWWKVGNNDLGTPRADTISQIPEGIPLLEAERIARELEPGDGSPQKSVIEQIDEALKEMGAG
jgi:tetratricopeptide (TPR) repeat protein